LTQLDGFRGTVVAAEPLTNLTTARKCSALIEKTDFSPEKVAAIEDWRPGMTLQDTTDRVLAPAQASVLAGVEQRFRSRPVGARLAHDLIAEIAAVLGVELAVYTETPDGWKVLAQTGESPTDDGVELSVVLSQLPIAIPTTCEIGGSMWTFNVATHGSARAALAVTGSWSGSAWPLSSLADAICLNAEKRRRSPSLESAARIGQILYRMTRELARAKTTEAVAHTVLRHASAAVRARMGAIAATPPGGDAAVVVATFGYALKLVEHVRIEPGVGVIGGVMSSRRPPKVDGTDRAPSRLLRYRTNSFVAVPILSGTEAVGALCVTDRVEDTEFSLEDVNVLRRFAATAALAIERERAVASAEKFAHAAAVDPITGVFNRRHLHVRLDEELQRSRRHNIPVAVLVLDIDDFKAINDSYGHLVGDLVLKDVAEILRRSVRVFDICARFGGDEFVIVMPGSAPAGAARIAERIREHIATYSPADRRLARLRLTASIGLAMSFLESTATDVLDRADQALYNAKHRGKNRVSTLEQQHGG